jgi:hypothetical protein
LGLEELVTGVSKVSLELLDQGGNGWIGAPTWLLRGEDDLDMNRHLLGREGEREEEREERKDQEQESLHDGSPGTTHITLSPSPEVVRTMA